MKKFAKVMAVLMCAALLVCGSIFGTLAYLTSQTPTLTNTFTVGSVSISLSECLVDNTGKKVTGTGAGRVSTTQEYKLVPGGEYDKDPTIHVNYGSEKCYLYARINNEIGAGNADPTKDSTVDQLAANGWTKLVDVTSTESIWYYSGKSATLTPTLAADQYDSEGYLGLGEHGKDYVLFTKIYINPAITDMTGLSGKKIEITAYAVQQEGFANAEAAWNATFGA